MKTVRIFDLSITQKLTTMDYSQLNINQKINVKANIEAYGAAFGTRNSTPLTKCMFFNDDAPVNVPYKYRINYSRKAKGGYYPRP